MRIDYLEPWIELPSGGPQGDALLAELQREIVFPHPLFGLPATPIARRMDCDDVLFRVGDVPVRYAVVHLSWTGEAERAPEWPFTEIFDTIQEFVERMKSNSFDFG